MQRISSSLRNKIIHTDTRIKLVEKLQHQSECTKIAHRRSLAIFTADSRIAGSSAVGINLVPFDRRENRRSLAIFDRKRIAHLGALKFS